MVVFEKGINNEKNIVIIHNDKHMDWDSSEKVLLWSEKYHIIIVTPSSDDNYVDIQNIIRDKCGNDVFAICSFHDEYQLVRKMIGHEVIFYDNFIVESKNCMPGKRVEEFIARA